jgi:hypothetical protein
MSKVWPLLLVIASGAGFFLAGIWVKPDTLNILNGGVLVATLVTITWYTIETRALRLQQEFDSEIRNHPWLRGSDLSVTWDKDRNVFGGRDTIYLPITNVGATPAHDLQAEIQWTVAGNKTRQGQNRIDGLMLAPNETGHLKLCEIDYEALSERATLDVEIVYKSFSGGSGRKRMNFFREPGKNWVNGTMSPYEFRLSDGRRFPARGQIER